jgi:hypothetical protein
MGAIHRDRYGVVRDERDAYQQLQDQFSGQMDFTTKMMEENGIEKERMMGEIAQIQLQLNAAVRALHGALQTMAPSVRPAVHALSSSPIKHTNHAIM